MKFIEDGKLYDTDTADLIHETGYGPPYGHPFAGWHGSALYLSPGNRFFYVFTYPHLPPAGYVLGGRRCIYKWQSGGDVTDLAIVWLQENDGAEAALQWWPERLWIG